MWDNLPDFDFPLADKTVRTIAVYLVVALLLRVVGRRDLAQLNSFDLVVMLLLSNVVQNAIIGPDSSLAGGLYGAVVLLAVNAGVGWLAARYPRFGRVANGAPVVLAHHGHYDRKVLRRWGIRQADLDLAVRRQGGTGIKDTTDVVLQPGGAVLVELRPDERGATHGDIAALRRQLDQIERRLADLTR